MPDPITLFTFFLVIVGLLQAYYLYGTLKATGIAAKAATDAVNLGRQEFLSTYRPRIILRDATSEQDMGSPITVEYILSNVGSTDAMMVSGALAVRVFQGWQFGPDNLPEINPATSDIATRSLKPGEQVRLSFTDPSLRWSTDNNTCHKFLEPEYGMFFSGQIVYEDVRGTRRHIGFRRKYFSEQHRFLSVGDSPHYEYHD